MKPSFVDILRCPKNGGELSLVRQDVEGDEIMEGKLIAPGGRDYNITGGVPRFVPTDAYASNFGLEWTIHRTTQIDRERSHESHDVFYLKTGFKPEELEGKLVLDVGVGTGRFADIALKAGAEVVGVDISLAVNSAYRNLGGNPHFHVAQADVFELPFAPQTFDHIFSIGVLHHTPDCKAAFMKLPSLLKPGGRIAIWVYKTDPQEQKSTMLWRSFTKYMPPPALYPLTSVWANAFYFARRKHPRIDSMVRRALPWFVYERLPVTSLEDNRALRELDTFDWYSPRYQSRHTNEQVVGWFEEAGLADIEVLDFPVSVVGRKPA